SASALIILNGCDKVTLSGDNGSSGRHLTLTNTNAGTSSAVVWGQTATGPDPVIDTELISLNLVGSGNTQTLIGAGFGGTTISVTSTGSGNNNNKVESCNVSKTQYGIYSAGASAGSKNTGTVIRNNLVNTASPNNVSIGGIYVRFEDGVQ